MSLSWRERVARTKKRLMEALDLTQEDWDYIKENIGMFCENSDEKMRAELRSRGIPETQENIDKLVEEMMEYQFVDMTKEIIEEIFEKLGYIKKKKRKKKQTEKEQEEEAVDSDSDSDSDSDGDTVEQEKEVEVENQ